MPPGRLGCHPFQGDGWLLLSLEQWPHETMNYAGLIDAWNSGTVERGNQTGHLVQWRKRELVLARPIKLTDPNWTWEREYGKYRERTTEPEYAAILMTLVGQVVQNNRGQPRFIPLGHHYLEETAIDYACRLLKAEEIHAGVLKTAGKKRW